MLNHDIVQVHIRLRQSQIAAEGLFIAVQVSPQDIRLALLHHADALRVVVPVAKRKLQSGKGGDFLQQVREDAVMQFLQPSDTVERMPVCGNGNGDGSLLLNVTQLAVV